MKLRNLLKEFLDKIDLKNITSEELAAMIESSGIVSLSPLKMDEQEVAYYDIKVTFANGNTSCNCGIYNNIYEAFEECIEYDSQWYSDISLHKLSEDEVRKRNELLTEKDKQATFYTFVDKFLKKKEDK